MRGLSLVAVSGGHSSSQCAGLSLLWPLLLRSTGSRRAGSVVVAHGPSCSAACGIFPGLESVSPALAGGFSTTAPPGKPPAASFYTRSSEADLWYISNLLSVHFKNPCPKCALENCVYIVSFIPCSRFLLYKSFQCPLCFITSFFRFSWTSMNLSA